MNCSNRKITPLFNFPALLECPAIITVLKIFMDPCSYCKSTCIRLREPNTAQYIPSHPFHPNPPQCLGNHTYNHSSQFWIIKSLFRGYTHQLPSIYLVSRPQVPNDLTFTVLPSLHYGPDKNVLIFPIIGGVLSNVIGYLQAAQCCPII